VCDLSYAPLVRTGDGDSGHESVLQRANLLLDAFGHCIFHAILRE